jgi:hypothetical protein
MSQHDNYKYSVTIRSDNLPLVASFRGLAWFCQTTGNRGIAWGGTGESEWRRDGHQVTFYFDHAAYRTVFFEHAGKLFPAEWEKIGERDDDPAKPAISN